MPLPTITGIARLVADPELRFTPAGAAVASVRLAFNSRRKNEQTQEWEDGDTFWVRGSAWRELAEHVAESLTKGMEVLVSGELKTHSWEKDGQKHQQPELNIRSIGPNLAYAIARVERANSSGSPGPQQAQRSQQSQQRQAPPHDDPWATGPSTTYNRAPAGGGYSDEPPF